MKKIIFITLALIGVFAVVVTGCSDGSSPDNGGDPPVTISFNTNSGSAVASIEIPHNTALPAAYFDTGAKVPLKEGFSFNGWKDGTEDVTPATTFTRNTTLTAQWAAEAPVTITFDTNGGNTITPLEILYNAVLPAAYFGAGANIPVRDNARFNGWKNGAVAVTTTTRFTQNATLTAQWQWMITVTFNLGTIEKEVEGGEDGETETIDVPGTPPADVTIENNTALGNKYPVNPLYTGYDFAGWFNSDKQYDRAERIDTNDDVFTLTARWELADTSIRPQVPAIHPGNHFVEIIPGGKLTATVNEEFNANGLFSNIEPGAGVLSSQWYRASTKDGAGEPIAYTQNAAAGNPHELSLPFKWRESAVGVYYYWVVVTNFNENATTEDKTASATTQNRLEVTVTAE